MRDLLQLSDNKILLLLFITAMFICVCSNILLVHSILEGEKKMKKICSIFGSFLLLLVFGFIICMTKYMFGRYFWFGLSFLIFYIPFWYGKIRLCIHKGNTHRKGVWKLGVAQTQNKRWYFEKEYGFSR